MTSPIVPLHYFIHVPKTAGVTVRAWLADAFERDEILFIYPGAIAEAPDGHTYSFETVVREHHRLLPTFRVFFGHYHFNSEWFVREGCRGLGFVREPKARAVSWYRYAVTNAETLPGPEMAQVADAVREGRAGMKQLYEEIGLLDLDNATVRYFAAANDPVGEIGEEQVQRAIDNVERHFDFVGHLDWFEQSMRSIADVLDRPYEPSEAKNVSAGASSRDLLGEFDADFLDSITRFDREFVDYIEGKYFR